MSSRSRGQKEEEAAGSVADGGRRMSHARIAVDLACPPVSAGYEGASVRLETKTLSRLHWQGRVKMGKKGRKQGGREAETLADRAN